MTQANPDGQELTFISSKDEDSLVAMAHDLMLSDMTSHRIQSKLLGDIA
jgi:hypothetical protein